MSTASRASTSFASECSTSYASTTASRSRAYSRLAQPSRRQSQIAAQALSHQPPIYIGPWQEFALGRALQPAGRRSGRRRVAVEAEPTETELNMLVQNFKALASRLDQEGARSMLRHSPLFMPTMQGLLNPTALDGPSVVSRHPAQAAVALRQVATLRLADTLLPPAAERRRGGRGSGSAVRAQRQQRLQQLQQMYSCGGSSSAAGVPPPVDATSADATLQAPPRPIPPRVPAAETPAKVSVGVSAVQPGAALPAVGAAAVRSPGSPARTRTPRLVTPVSRAARQEWPLVAPQRSSPASSDESAGLWAALGTQQDNPHRPGLRVELRCHRQSMPKCSFPCTPFGFRTQVDRTAEERLCWRRLRGAAAALQASATNGRTRSTGCWNGQRASTTSRDRS